MYRPYRKEKHTVYGIMIQNNLENGGVDIILGARIPLDLCTGSEHINIMIHLGNYSFVAVILFKKISKTWIIVMMTICLSYISTGLFFIAPRLLDVLSVFDW